MTTRYRAEPYSARGTVPRTTEPSAQRAQDAGLADAGVAGEHDGGASVAGGDQGLDDVALGGREPEVGVADLLGDRTWRTQDLDGRASPPAQLAPRATGAVADETQWRDLVAHRAARHPLHPPPRQREGDRRQVEQPTGGHRGGHDQHDRAAPLARVAPRLDHEQRGALGGARQTSNLALA